MMMRCQSWKASNAGAGEEGMRDIRIVQAIYAAAFEWLKRSVG
jgi:hypothetical protein